MAQTVGTKKEEARTASCLGSHPHAVPELIWSDVDKCRKRGTHERGSFGLSKTQGCPL